MKRRHDLNKRQPNITARILPSGNVEVTWHDRLASIVVSRDEAERAAVDPAVAADLLRRAIGK